MVAFHFRLLLYLEFSGQLLRYPLEHLHAEFGMDNLASPEEHNDFCLVTLIDKPVDIPDLQCKVMFIYLGPNLDFLDIDGFSLRMFFAQLIAVFSEIKYLADRRGCAGRYFNQIKVSLLRERQTFSHRHNAQLLAVMINEPDLLRPDLLVHADVFADVPIAYWSPPVMNLFRKKRDKFIHAEGSQIITIPFAH